MCKAYVWTSPSTIEGSEERGQGCMPEIYALMICQKTDASGTEPAKGMVCLSDADVVIEG
jgi:hypothetical protein